MGSESVLDAVRAIQDGNIVVVVDDEQRENEGDLVMAAEHATAKSIAFFVRHTSGFICTAITSDRADALNLPLMVPNNTERQRTAFTVTVDYSNGRICGASAVDRARTARALSDSRTQSDDFERPGHMHVLRAEPLGVLRRPGHTEAAVDLARLAGLSPAGVLCEVVTQDGLGMARGAELEVFAAKHGLPLLRIEDLIRYRYSTEKLVSRVRQFSLSTDMGEFRALEYESLVDGSRLMAVVMGSPSPHRKTLLGIHYECLAGNVFGSRACSCRRALESTLWRIARVGTGVALYFCGPSPRRNRASGCETMASVSVARGAPVAEGTDWHRPSELDEDDRWVVTQVLTDLGVQDVSLINTSTPLECQDLGLRAEGTHPLRLPRTPRVTIRRGSADSGIASSPSGSMQPLGRHRG